MTNARKVSKKKTESGNGVLKKVLLFPPLLSFPVVFFASGRHTPDPHSAFAPTLLAFVLAWLILSLLYLPLYNKQKMTGAVGVALTADGILFLFAGYGLGAGGGYSWIGTALFALGLCLAVVQYFTKTKPQSILAPNAPARLLPEGMPGEDVYKLLEAIALPSALLEVDEWGTEKVLTINEPLAATLAGTRASLEGSPLPEYIPSEDDQRVKIGDTDWVVQRRGRGDQVLLILVPTLKGADDDDGGVSLELIDSETGLFSPAFLRYKANSDINSCRRYRRELCAILYNLSLDRGMYEIVPSEETVKRAISAFGRMVAESIRVCDSAYRLNENDILIMLPETPRQGASIVKDRIDDGARKLSTMECIELQNIRIKSGLVAYVGDELVSVEQVIKDASYVASQGGEAA